MPSYIVTLKLVLFVGFSCICFGGGGGVGGGMLIWGSISTTDIRNLIDYYFAGGAY